MGSHGRSQSGIVRSQSAGMGRHVRSLHGRSNTIGMARHERSQLVRFRFMSIGSNPRLHFERFIRAPVDTVIRILLPHSIGRGAVAPVISVPHAVVSQIQAVPCNLHSGVFVEEVEFALPLVRRPIGAASAVWM